MGKAKGLLGKYGASYFLLSFWLILFLVFTVIPIAISVVMSFTDFDMVRLPRFVGLQNYTTLFLDDDIFIKSLGNTLFYALVTGPAGYLLSFLVAWLLSETSRGVRAGADADFLRPDPGGQRLYGLDVHIQRRLLRHAQQPAAAFGAYRRPDPVAQ